MIEEKHKDLIRAREYIIHGTYAFIGFIALFVLLEIGHGAIPGGFIFLFMGVGFLTGVLGIIGITNGIYLFISHSRKK